MAGILDGLLGSGDINDPKTQGILALAMGLLQAGGASRVPVGLGAAIGQAGQGGLQAYQSAIDTGLKRKLTQAQLEDISNQAMLRNMTAQKMLAEMKGWDTLDQLGGSGQQPSGQTIPSPFTQNTVNNKMSAGPMGGGFTQTPQGLAPTGLQGTSTDASSGLSGLGKLTATQVAGLSARVGRDLFPAWNAERSGTKVDSGWRISPTGQWEFIPQMDTQGNVITATGSPSNPTIAPAAGAVNTRQQFAAAAAAGAKQGEAPYNQVTLKLGDREVQLSGQEAKDYFATGALPDRLSGISRPPATPQGTPGPYVDNVRTNLVGPQQMIQDLISRVTDPQQQAEMRKGYAAQLASQFNPQAPGAPTLGVGANPAEVAKSTAIATLSPKTLETGNQQWQTTTFPSVMSAGDAAKDRMTSIETSRNTLAKVGDTGWSTDKKAAAANVLGAFGFKNAAQFAGNAQMFQNQAMGHLQTVLNAAKGNQTEGDAARAMQTFPMLTNQSQANQFILDLSQAIAERDQMRQKFYLNMTPKVRESATNGLVDLTQVDRLWNENMPSVWSNPIMQKWVSK